VRIMPNQENRSEELPYTQNSIIHCNYDVVPSHPKECKPSGGLYKKSAWWFLCRIIIASPPMWWNLASWAIDRWDKYGGPFEPWSRPHWIGLIPSRSVMTFYHILIALGTVQYYIGYASIPYRSPNTERWKMYSDIELLLHLKSNLKQVPTICIMDRWAEDRPSCSTYVKAVILNITRSGTISSLSGQQSLRMPLAANHWAWNYVAMLWLMDSMVSRNSANRIFCLGSCQEGWVFTERYVWWFALIAGTIVSISILRDLRRSGWAARMEEVSCELRKRCLHHLGEVLKIDVEDLQRRNLEGCIEDILMDCGDLMKEDGEDWQDFLEPAFRDIVI
jgi:hypothetical protein